MGDSMSVDATYYLISIKIDGKAISKFFEDAYANECKIGGVWMNDSISRDIEVELFRILVLSYEYDENKIIEAVKKLLSRVKLRISSENSELEITLGESKAVSNDESTDLSYYHIFHI